MKKFLASILALTMVFSLVGGIPSVAEEMNDPFAEKESYPFVEHIKADAEEKSSQIERYIKAAREFIIAEKDEIPSICYDNLMRKYDYISSTFNRNGNNIGTKEMEKIKENIYNLERESWAACKDYKGGDSNSVAVRNFLKRDHMFLSLFYNFEKTSFLEKIKFFVEWVNLGGQVLMKKILG